MAGPERRLLDSLDAHPGTLDAEWENALRKYAFLAPRADAPSATKERFVQFLERMVVLNRARHPDTGRLTEQARL